MEGFGALCLPGRVPSRAGADISWLFIVAVISAVNGFLRLVGLVAGLWVLVASTPTSRGGGLRLPDVLPLLPIHWFRPP